MKGIIKKVIPVSLEVGYPETKEELEAMFRLRAKVYTELGYITAENDKDEYDLKNKCAYFIAKLNEKLVGTVRVVIDDPLPIEVHFNFKEPEEMARIPRNKRGEISRLTGVVKGLNHLVSLSLIKAITEWSKENDFPGGYSFIQSYLVRILNSVGFPIHLIEPYTLKNIKGSPFYAYLNESGSEVLPIWYLRDEAIVWFEKMKF